MSAKQLEHILGVTYKIVLILCHRVREATDGAAEYHPLGGPNTGVDADATYLGGKAKNRFNSKPAPQKPIRLL